MNSFIMFNNMIHLQFFSLVVLAVIVNCLINEMSPSNYFERYKGKEIKNMAVTSNTTTISETSCVLSCLQLINCKAVVWSLITSVCSIMTHTTFQLIDSLDSILYRKVIDEKCRTLFTAQGEILDCTGLDLILPDCQAFQRFGFKSNGIYKIKTELTLELYFPVFCDMETDGGGWMVFQKRFDGSVSFNHTWDEYEEGFGDVHGEHWLGLKFLHEYTSKKNTSLRVDLLGWESEEYYAMYGRFSIGSNISNYMITFRDYSGTASNALDIYHQGKGFSTPDKDFSNGCAKYYGAHWWMNWYPVCFRCNLNGKYHSSSKAEEFAAGINWYFNNIQYSNWYSWKTTSMKMR